MIHSLLISLLLLTPSARAGIEVRGRVFYEKAVKDGPAFLFRSLLTTKDGKTQVIAVYSDMKGKELVRETNYFEGEKLVRSVYQQKQVSEKGEVLLGGGKARFTFTDHEGTESDSEDEEPDMILGSMVGGHVLKHWDELMKGDSVKVRYMAVERCESIGFKFYKKDERKQDGKTLVDIVMKPSSFFIAAVVNPIILTFENGANRHLVQVEGRTPIRWPRNDPPKGRKDWKAIDARMEFDSPKEVPDSTPI